MFFEAAFAFCSFLCALFLLALFIFGAAHFMINVVLSNHSLQDIQFAIHSAPQCMVEKSAHSNQQKKYQTISLDSLEI